jgi:hypothetical protein
MTMTTEPDFQVMLARADAFREGIADVIDEAVAAVDPESPWADAGRCGLRRIGGSLGQISDVTLLNLRTLDIAMGGTIMETIRVKLTAVGCGRSLDFVDAAALLAEFAPLIEAVRRRRFN